MFSSYKRLFLNVQKTEQISKTRTYHDSCWNGVPFQPESDEGRCDQDYSRYEYCREVEGSVPREDQVDFQAAVVACNIKLYQKYENKKIIIKN